MSNTNQKVGVFWSAGLESTLLLLQCIAKYGKENVVAFTQKFSESAPPDAVKHYQYYARIIAEKMHFDNWAILEVDWRGDNSLSRDVYDQAVASHPEITKYYVGLNTTTFGILADDSGFRSSVVDSIAALGNVEMPFLKLMKCDTVRMYYEQGYEEWVPLTRSCAKNTYIHCGTCANCRERQQGFKLAGAADPTEYMRL